MKKYFIFLWVFIVTSFVILSCTKNTADSMTEEQAVENLVTTQSFHDFSKTFIPDLMELVNYHRSVIAKNQRAGFIRELKTTGDDETKIPAVYEQFGLQFENVITLKNKVDNDILALLNQNRFLLQFDEVQTKRILLNAMEKGFHSKEFEWQRTKEAISNRLGRPTPFAQLPIFPQTNGMAVNKAGLTLDEVWNCLKEAVGVGSTGVLGIAGLTKLAKDGIQEVVIATSKWLAKKAGWIGAAITLFEFGDCIYSEAID